MASVTRSMTRCRSCSAGEAAGSTRATWMRWRFASKRRPRHSGCVRLSVAVVGYCGFSVVNEVVGLLPRIGEVEVVRAAANGVSPVTCGVTLNSVWLSLPLALPPRIEATGVTAWVRYAAESEDRVVDALRAADADSRPAPS